MFSRWFCGPRVTNDVGCWAISGLIEESHGVTAIEYALIAVAAIAAFTLVGTNLSTTFSYVASQL
jgi:Flp pilus assembly pilin Flp